MSHLRYLKKAVLGQNLDHQILSEKVLGKMNCLETRHHELDAAAKSYPARLHLCWAHLHCSEAVRSWHTGSQITVVADNHMRRSICAATRSVVLSEFRAILLAETTEYLPRIYSNNMR